jgi:ribosome modulation factor
MRGERGSLATSSDCVEVQKMILVVCSQNGKKGEIRGRRIKNKPYKVKQQTTFHLCPWRTARNVKSFPCAFERYDSSH